MIPANNTIILSLILLLFTLNLSAKLDPIVFKNINQGLSQSSVSSIAEDEYGFLWIGTMYGLNRYDGVQFKQFLASPSDSFKLKENYIKCLLPDKKGHIWVGTYGGGLHKFDIKKEIFRQYESQEFPTDHISSILQLNDKELLVAIENGGLLVFNIEKEKFRHYNENKTEAQKILPKIINSIVKDSFGNIWIGAISDGLRRIDSKTKRVDICAVNKTPQGENSVRSIEVSRDGRIWVGTNNGLLNVSFKKNGSFEKKDIQVEENNLAKILNEVAIISLCADSSTLWVGTENFGLFRICLETDLVEQHLYNPNISESISGNSIWAIHQTNNNEIWAGGYFCGFNKVMDPEKNIRYIDKEFDGKEIWNCKNITAFARDKDDNLWYSTDGNGLFSIQKNGKVKHFTTETPKLKLKSNNLLSINIDADDNIWIGSWGGSVSIIDKSRKTIKHLMHDSFYRSKMGDCKNIHDIKIDKQDRIWVASSGVGISVINYKKQEVTNFYKDTPDRQITSNLVISLLPDSKGNIWIGTINNGLEKFELDQQLNIRDRKRYFISNDLSGVSINTIVEKEDGKIIVGTSGHGIAVINPSNDSIQYIKAEDGLPSDLIYSLLIDNDGLLWGTTNNAIFSYDFETKKVKLFYSQTGDKPSDFVINSQFKIPTGKLLFGASNGYCVIDPNTIELNQDKPKVYITSMSIGGTPYSSDEGQVKALLNNQQIILPHAQNDLSIDFTSISFHNAAQNQFQYKLENHDRDWKNTRTDRFADYANLPPGNYTFKVKGSNSDGLWNEEFASMDIRIKAPWYQTNLAYGFYFIGVLILGYFIRKQIIRRLKLKNQLKLEQLEVEKMQELDKIKADFFTNISHEFKTPLTLIMSPLASLMKEEGIKPENKKLYKIIMKNSEYLNRLINQILDISRIESGNAKLKANEYDMVSFVKQIAQNFSIYANQAFITFKVNTPDKKVPIFFDQEKMEKVLINILSNAFKFTPNHGEISIDLSEQKQFIEISISDNGVGIDEKNLEKIFERFYKSEEKSSAVSTGIGLALSKQLVNLHSGTLTAKSQQYPTKETIFTIRLKKGVEHLKEAEITKIQAKPIDLNTKKAEVSFLQSTTDTIDSSPTIKDDRAIVLVVEDNDDMRMFISSILKKKYKVIKAPDGKIGYEMALKFIPEIIISDVMMPTMNGYQLTKAIKENPLTCHIFMILLTAKASEGSVSEGFKLGVDSYLTKPFNPHLLELKVKNLLQTRKRFKKQITDIEKINLSPDAIPYSKMDEDFIKKIIGEIEKNISEPSFKVDDLCIAIGYSKSQLYRKLKGLTGKSTKEFIRMIRLKRAAQLLQQKDLRISEITFQTGFTDLQNFRDAFKKQYGMSPKQYREKETSKV